MTPIEKMLELVPSLPEKDQKYALKFINNRDFESLSELVASDIVIVSRKFKKASELTEEELAALNEQMANMDLFQLTVDEYRANTVYESEYDVTDEFSWRDKNHYLI